MVYHLIVKYNDKSPEFHSKANQRYIDRYEV